jgi:hypothetical protein
MSAIDFWAAAHSTLLPARDSCKTSLFADNIMMAFASLFELQEGSLSQSNLVQTHGQPSHFKVIQGHKINKPQHLKGMLGTQVPHIQTHPQGC